MGIRKDYLLSDASLAMVMLKGLWLHDAVVVRKVIPARWVRSTLSVEPAELDAVGVRVTQGEGDVFDFTLTETPDSYFVSDVVGQWRVEALGAIETGEMSLSALARRCGLTRQAVYLIVKAKQATLSHLFMLRGRNPLLTWRGVALSTAFRRVQGDLVLHELMEKIV